MILYNICTKYIKGEKNRKDEKRRKENRKIATKRPICDSYI